jgi:nucleoid-associated protein YgaU
MTKKRLSPTLFLAISLGIFSATGMVGCSTHSAGGGDDDSDSVPPPDAGTDAVPTASADGSTPPADGAAPATNPDGTPATVAAATDSPPPPADGGVPPGGADAPPPAPDAAAAATPPPVDMAAATPPPAAPDASAAPAAPAAPAVAAAAPVTPPPVDTAPAPAPAPAPAAASVASDDHGSGGTSDYTVRAGDTLMKIAFENYGDLYKWKDIYQQNHDAIKNPNDGPPGTVLHLDKPSVPVAIERNGDQYLIKSGDTLGTISNDVYGTKAKWKKIWNNNKQLIKDPNKIYAGFYLFYTLTPSERKSLEERGGPGHAPAPLAEAEGDGSQSVADSATAAPEQPQAQAQPIAQAAAPQAMQQQTVAQAKPVQMDNRAPAAVAAAKAPVTPGTGSDDLNQVVQQVH